MVVIGADLRPAAGLKFKFPARNRTYGSFCGHGLVLARTYGPTTVTLQSNISVCKMQGSKRVTSWGSSSEVNTPIMVFGVRLQGRCSGLRRFCREETQKTAMSVVVPTSPRPFPEKRFQSGVLGEPLFAHLRGLKKGNFPLRLAFGFSREECHRGQGCGSK